MSELENAIEYYHSLLSDAVASQSQEQLTRQLHRRQLFFGERPLCTVLRPRFLTAQQYQLLRSAIREVMPAFAKAHQVALNDSQFRLQFNLEDWEEELIRVDPRFSAPSPTARMDTFLVTEALGKAADEQGVGLFFAEYNAETPAAAAYNDSLSEVFLALPVMGAFQRRYEVRPLPGRQHVLHALLDSYHQWGGRERPRIAILDWREVPTYSEFMLFQEYFISQGYECVIADPRQLEYRHGQLLVDGITPVHLIYKRVLLSELVVREGLDHPVIRAVSEHAVCMVNPFRCKLLHKKSSFAVLSDEANADLFSAEERRAIDQYIPWTRNVTDRRTTLNGQQIELLPYLSNHKDDFVLKPNDEYGGTGIVLGWETEQSQWDEALEMARQKSYIVQQRIAIPREAYPSLVEGNLQIFDRLIDTNPYIWYGEYVSGCLTRLSTAELLNVTAGGGSAVPTFIIEERS
ncbi:MAG: hypothetical protein JSV61_11585 [Anaerolineales bacterium]|nr:MAG: hypothetical protein JSV61_11585 [Anaerolineales bacterium]